MTPAEIGAWLAAHGGPAGGSGPDANGVIVNRAADGSTLTVRRITPDRFEVVEANEATPGAAVPAPPTPSAPTPAPGGGMNQQDLEARLAAIAPGGDTRRLEHTVKRVRKKVLRSSRPPMPRAGPS